MKKLAEKEYWDSVYRDIEQKNKKNYSNLNYLRQWLKKTTRDYSDYFMWEVLFKKILPVNSSFKAIEIGCAPGKYILKLNSMFGYMPHGVDYSEQGCEITRNNFVKAGFNPDSVVKADFFDQGFLDANSDIYDVVYSRGFIEHFDNPKQVIDNHFRLLKKGGYLIILIPNLRGLNYYLLNFFNIDSLLTHNLSVMDKSNFCESFKIPGLEKKFCNYIGFFSFGLLNTNRKWKYYIYRFLLLVQRPFDFLFRVLLGEKTLRFRYTSPYLLYIGQKR